MSETNDKPLEEMTAAELRTYAEARQIDLSGTKNKGEMLQRIQDAARATPPAGDGDQVPPASSSGETPAADGAPVAPDAAAPTSNEAETPVVTASNADPPAQSAPQPAESPPATPSPAPAPAAAEQDSELLSEEPAPIQSMIGTPARDD